MLLVVDNHDYHISIDSLDFCKANGILMLLTFLARASGKLQPLDVTVTKKKQFLTAHAMTG